MQVAGTDMVRHGGRLSLSKTLSGGPTDHIARLLALW
jgi:hypothetical protein